MARLNRALLQELAETRLGDAELLLAEGRYSAAYYLAGYSIECAIKACIAKSTREHDYPDKKLAIDCYSHNLRDLLKLTGIPSASDFQADSDLDIYWSQVCGKWSESGRYSTFDEIEARELIQAIADPNHGVLQWLRRYW